MATIPVVCDPTLAAIDAAIVESQDAMPRHYLGMSSIGHPCERKLWFDFRWSATRSFDTKTIKRFEDGHRGEDIQAARLRMVKGINLQTHDARTGKQFGFEACGGHVKGHMDGAIVGLLQAPKTWHVWEHKQVNEAKFKKLIKLKEKLGEKNALKEWDAIYHGQALLYMRCSGMERHYLTCSTPGGRDTVSVRTDADKAEADRLFAKAQRIVDAAEPPPGISERPDWYECKLCDYHDLCHSSDVPPPTCRSCAHVTPITDGQWHCTRNNKLLDVPAQKAACQSHRYIPVLLQRFADVVDANTEANWIKYQHRVTCNEFINGLPPEGYESVEIYSLEDKKALGDASVQAFRFELNGRIAA